MRWVYYFLLLFSFQFYVSLLPGYSVIKYSLAKEFDFSESFLGFVDMLSMIGRLLISLYFILIPAKRLKLTYFICALLQTLGLSLVASLHIFPHFSKPFYMIGMTLFGLGRVPAFLYLILVDHFDEEQDQQSINIWYGLIDLGNVFGYLFIVLLLQNVQLHWSTSLLVLVAIFFIFGGLTFLMIPQTVRQVHNHTICQEIVSSLLIIKQHYGRQKSNSLYLLDFFFQENHDFFFFFWSSYYFNEIGFGYTKSAIISLSFPICAFLGSMILNPILGCFPEHASVFTVILLFNAFISSIFLAFLEADMSSFPYYIIFLGLTAFNSVVPYSMTMTTDLASKTESPEEKYIILNFIRLIQEGLTGLILLITGYFMKDNILNFIYIYIILQGATAIVHLIRKLVERGQISQVQPSQSQSF